MIRPALFLACATLLAAQQPAPTAPTAAPASSRAPEKSATPTGQLAVPEPGRFKTLFQPYRTETAALSPDGKYLAYSIHEEGTLSVAVVEIDHPERMLSKVAIASDRDATEMLAQNQAENTPAHIVWMRWTTPTRVTVETNTVSHVSYTDDNWTSLKGQILAFDADGKNARVLLRPADLTEPIPRAGFFALPPGVSARTAASTYDMSKAQGVGEDGSNLAEPTVPRDFLMSQPLGGRAADRATPAPDVISAPATGDPVDPEKFPTTPDGGKLSPQTFHIFDLDPDKPGCVTLVAVGTLRNDNTRRLSFQRLDTVTGKVEQLEFDYLTASSDALIDRLGRLRLTLPNSLRTPFPFLYQYLGAKGASRPQPFERTGGIAGASVSPANYFGERAIPLAFDADPNILYYASNFGRDTYGIYSYDLAAKKRGGLKLENPAFDLIPPPSVGFPGTGTLVFDRFQHHKLAGVRFESSLHSTAWLRPDLHGLQLQLEKMFAGRSIEIVDWDQTANRFLFTAEGPGDPGAFYLYDAGKGKLSEFARRAPWVDAQHVHPTLPFSFVETDGTTISGLVTVPQQPRLKPIPMLVICPDRPWDRVNSDFRPEIHALADMGFAVVQFNGRGAWGLGLKHRQALTAGYDLVQVEDLTATVAGLEKIFNVSTKRVALLGRGHGGFVALRALQEHPDKFRCAIALDAPVDLADWLAEQKWTDDDVLPHLTRGWLGDDARLKARPLTSHPELLTKPALMLNYPGPEGFVRRTAYVAAKGFAASVNRHGGTVEFEDLPTDYTRGLPAARAAVFDRVEEFLNVHVYDFQVKLKEMQIIK